MQRPYGFHPVAFKAYLSACEKCGIDPDRVTQTIGNAKASAGFHAKDGIVLDGAIPRAYCAATDLSIRNLSDNKIKEFLAELARVGFVGWYRYRNSFANNRHIHMVWAGCKMKPQLRRQFHDFVNRKDGLASHDWEDFWHADNATDNALRVRFFQFNPVNG